MMVFFFVCEAYIEKKKPPIGHQTCITIMAGIVVSGIFWAAYGKQHMEDFNFSQEAFFNFFLPPIIFNSGYNMRKKKFFKNLGNIAIFGLFVTFVCFGIYSVGTYWMLNSFNFQMTNYYNLSDDVPYEGPNPRPLELSMMKILLYTSLMCSSDVVAAVSIVDYNKQPKLFSCIFGEGVVNDIVSIILFGTVLSLQKVDFTYSTPLLIIGQFIMLGVVSMAIGLIFGFFNSWIFKVFKFLRVNAITETFLILSISMLCYFISELTVIGGVKMSGIISLLTCGIIQSHYNYYNLSDQGKITSTLTVSFIGTASEAGVYSYIGLSLYSQIPGWWAWDFIFW